MASREWFARRGTRRLERRVPLGTISDVKTNVPLIERETTPVAIAGTHFLGQPPLDGIRAERYIGKSAQVVPPLE